MFLTCIGYGSIQSILWILKPKAEPRVFKSTKIIWDRSITDLENGLLRNVGITN